jgi:hypothetical protein
MFSEELSNKWKPILEHEALSPIKDPHKRATVAQLLENTVRAVSESRGADSHFLTETPTTSVGTGGYSSSSAAAGPVAGYDPVLISLVRRTMPNLIAYDIAGVQPMSGPTGMIFAMRSRYTNQSGAEAFYGEADTDFSGSGSYGGAPVHAGGLDGTTAGKTTGTAVATGVAESLGSTGPDFAEMSFSIEKIAVQAKSRALKAEYTSELAQDLKAIHGLDAEAELANILTSEVLAEINREIIRTVYLTGVAGSQVNVAVPGQFDLDVDSNGRWSVEKFKGLMFHIEREANEIAKQTRRGKGNIILCSSDVASALQMAGVLDYTPALNSNNLAVDDTGNTFAGVLNGRYRVYIDPYSTGNYMVVGYKGSNAMDAGIFYCPYVPLQMVRAIGESNFQPKIGFKTRYGLVANPYAQGATQGLGALTANTNVYYRRTQIMNIA